jgi:hypothetical protein
VPADNVFKASTPLKPGSLEAVHPQCLDLDWRENAYIFHREIGVQNINYSSAGQPIYKTGRIRVVATSQRKLTPPSPLDPVTATMHALEDVADIVSNGRFAHPDTLTQNEVLTYALALLRVRECAGMAGMERLMNACDAIAITVSRLIDDLTSANQTKCEALTRFVVYAREMILISANEPATFVMLPFHTPTIRFDSVAR